MTAPVTALPENAIGKARQRKQFQIETAGTISWLAMDFFWMLEFSATAVSFGLTSLALWIWALDFPTDKPERAATAAIVQWVLMNLIWMTSDQYDMPDLRRWAVVTALLSLLLIFYSLWLAGWNFSLARYFRRFRMRG